MAMTFTKNQIAPALLILFHVVGVAGLLSPYKDLVLQLTPVNLILSTVLLLSLQVEYNRSFWLFCSIIFLSGFFLEVAGIHTGLIFGNYQYGNTLGIQFLNVPLVMGFNWLMLIYSAGVIFEPLKTNKYIKSLLGAGLLVGLDLLLEPVAMKYDFWIWSNETIPLQNYVAWFVAAFFMLLLFYNLNFSKNNRLALLLYIVQFVFFSILNIF
ncbi:MAG: carotenoid biosynthesis protein [Bacteroidetes bacterium]|nr:carotenoid biosynthesis protein [Bacteroidota bacterium]